MQHMKIKDTVAYKVDIHGEGMSDKWEEFWCWWATAAGNVQYMKNAFNTCPTILSALHNVGSIFVPTPSMKSTVTNEKIEQNTANTLYFYTCQLMLTQSCREFQNSKPMKSSFNNLLILSYMYMILYADLI